VGPLEWQGQHYDIEYGVNVNHTNVSGLCDNIKIVHEEGDNPKLEEAQELIRQADRIFFLGFGYAEENLNALGIPDVLEDVKQVFGTTLGLTNKEKTEIKSLFKTDINNKLRSVYIQDMDCLSLLREYL
jgi:hypothetical protein